MEMVFLTVCWAWKDEDMTTSRPTLTSELLAAIIDAAPGRVRKRLDRQPAAASDWSWNHAAHVWTIQAGEETVRLQVDADDHLTTINDVACSCLLSPKCFHVLACVTSLAVHDPTSVAEAESAADESSSPNRTSSEIGTDVNAGDPIEISDAVRQAAIASLRAIDGVLVSGARASGVIIQSSLLRAAHQGRAEGLVHLSAALIRTAEGIQRLRRGDDHTDSEALRRDIVIAIDAAAELRQSETLTPAKTGFARRPFSPVSLRSLDGAVAEPILTRSGYAGVATHLIGDDQQLYQIVETRPGDATLIGQAYRGGIDLGTTTASAQTLSRSHLDVQNLSCSPDGRLGKGSKTRWAIDRKNDTAIGSGSSSWERWSVPLGDQVAAVFEQATSPAWLRRGGWDLVCVRGVVLGVSGRTVALEHEGSGARLRLGISIDHASLPFRENLQLLARCPGLAVEVVGRVQLDQAGLIDGLTLRGLSDDWILPDSWAGRCHLGLDRLQRHHLRSPERFASEVDAPPAEPLQPGSSRQPDTRSSSQTDLFSGLERHCTALVLGGRDAVGSIGSASHRRDQARLVSRGQVAAASLLDSLAMACAEAPAVTRRNRLAEDNRHLQRPLVLAAAAAYLDASRRFYEREQWMRVLGCPDLD
ncbi:hypothetical protein [Allorhodopirellula solitaria]|uniref:SWIM-type domain-containing protein n=1 Tax=Allorhodopirellula solitaria TaxID=2527987 RepID=A0A5C5XS11_9BACT|nr:hypothetical protein [Allorhodopirellula solitaria]TWT65311.1 hypothetical protein CA85_32230 [Allorhodopirellula solitaria]